jgi:hypothetical protein
LDILNAIRTSDNVKNIRDLEEAVKQHLKEDKNKTIFYACYNCFRNFGVEKIMDNCELVEEELQIYMIKLECNYFYFLFSETFLLFSLEKQRYKTKF